MARTRHLDFDEGADSSRFVTALARGLDVLATKRRPPGSAGEAVEV